MPDEIEVLVKLTLVDDSGKRLESAPEETTAGLVRLHKWQVHPVTLASGVFDGAAAYLIKVNYELELESGIPPMPWFEFGLHFDPDTSATVLDAVPQGSQDPRPTASYTLNRHLQLIPVNPDDEAPVHVPALEERIDLYGIGSRSIRWRYSSRSQAGVRPGSRTAWLLLLAPANRTQQRCRLAVRYALQVDEDLAYQPTQEPAAFSITLGEPAAAVDPSPTAPVRTEKADIPISVFVCYAHESTEFKRDVRKLAQLLQDVGLDPHLDQFDVGPRKHWGHWSLHHMRTCDFTLVMASPMLRAVGDGLVKDKHFGLQSELTKLETLYQTHSRWREYVLPVILPGQSPTGIPLFLGPAHEDYYLVDDYTSQGVAYLIEAIRKTGRRAWDFE